MCMLIVFFSFFYEMLPLRMTITNEISECSSAHHHLFFTCGLQKVVTLLVVLCLASTTQLMVVFFLFFDVTNGSFLLVFCYRHYKKKRCFAIGLVIQFLSCIGHLQLTIFISCECSQTSCKSYKSCNSPYIRCNSLQFNYNFVTTTLF
jgi:hypothetical protein